MERLIATIYKTDKIGNWMARVEGNQGVVVLAGSRNKTGFFRSQRVWVEELMEMRGEQPRTSYDWLGFFDPAPARSFSVKFTKRYGPLDGEVRDGRAPELPLVREKLVIRTEHYQPGGEFDRRIETALANVDIAGISALVLYDPSPGGVKPYQSPYEPLPVSRERYHIIIAVKKWDKHDLTAKYLSELWSSPVNATVGAASDAGGAYYITKDFRNIVKANPREGHILFVPIPGLVYKQQWGPDHSKIEPAVVAKCIQIASSRLSDTAV